jgi:hypothetical protein
MYIRLPQRAKGATLGLVAASVLILTLVGSACYFFLTMLGGNRQVTSATDAGALAAARSLFSITVGTSTLPSEFQQLGVDLGTGAPDSVNGQMNILAYNRAAGAALLIALNANEEATSQAYVNANKVIGELESFGGALNTAISSAVQLNNSAANLFQQMAQENSINLMGNNSTVNLINNLTVAAVNTDDSGGKSNVYFNPAVFGNDTTLAASAAATVDSTGKVVSVINQSYASNQPGAAGQSFVQGYSGIQVNKNINSIYACALNPGQTPHLIDLNRFNAGSPPQATPSVATSYAPVNALMGQTQTQITNLPGHVQANLSTTAIACSILGCLNNEYPISLPSGYVRIHNGFDAMYANPTTLSPIYDSVNANNSIFNNELYVGPGGLGPVYVSNNNVFCTETWESVNGPSDPTPANYVGSAEMEAWVNYNKSTGSDPYGKNGALDPSNPANTTNLGLVCLSPSNNMRIGNNTNEQAQITDMRAITSVAGTCVSTMYDGDLTGPCLTEVNSFTYNYDRGVAVGASPIVEGQSTGGLTCLEYAKGQVITDFQNLLNAGDLNNQTQNYRFNIDFGGDSGSEFQNPSGSKIYTRNVGYASPANSPSVAFCTLGSPGQLCDQITNNSSTPSINLSNSSYCTANSVQGKLFQRCLEIFPGATWSQIATLLYTYPIDLGQYQYIYYNASTGALAISQTPPGCLSTLPEYTNPGITQPDGVGSTTNPAPCDDTPWAASHHNSGPVGAIINASIGTDGNSVGDNNLEAAPFEEFRGTVKTYDSVSFTPSSGKDNLLGELDFYNYVSGSGQFSAPN